MAVQDVLSRLARGEYGNEVPQVNAFDQAQTLANAILQYQKQKQAAPYAQAIQNYGQQWKAAQTDEERRAANTAANLARATYLQKGGSPTDLSANLWGSTPSQGFQVGAGEYKAPYEGGDNLTLGQKMKIAALTGMFQGQPTWEKQYQESGLTGLYQGDKTWPRQYQEQSLADAMKRAYLSAARTGGSVSATKNQSLAENINNELAHLQDLADSYGSQTYANKYSTEEGVLAPIQAAEKDINTNRSFYIGQGIDPDELINELYKKLYGVSRSEYWRNANAALKTNNSGGLNSEEINRYSTEMTTGG